MSEFSSLFEKKEIATMLENNCDATSAADNDGILQGLSGPITAPSAPLSNHHSELSSKTKLPSKETAKKHANQPTPRIFYSEEEGRQRRAERQKKYRERQMRQGDQLKNQFASTAEEIKASRLERDSLLIQNTVLSKATEYCIYSLQAAQTLVSNTAGIVQIQFNTTVEWLRWFSLQGYCPSDAQLHAFLDRKSPEDFHRITEKIGQKCYDLYAQYESEPEKRANIEVQLQRVQNMRFRSFNYLVNTRPGVVVGVVKERVMPAELDGSPNPKLVEAVAVLDLTPEQLESFEQQWMLYLQNTRSMRQEARSLISFLTAPETSNEDLLSACSAVGSGMFMEKLEAVQELEQHASKEARAVANLILWLPENLTTHQKAILMKYCMPYYPDVIQMGRILFEDNNMVQAGRVQSVHPELEDSLRTN